ncbi:hypothetical protein [Natronoflexus pectinivorans]|nr:hypothetical protein [Natronoflexus pectinivorans]
MTNCKQSSQDETIQKSVIPSEVIESTISAIIKKHPDTDVERLTRGVNHTASLWWPADGDNNEFKTWCKEHFIPTDKERKAFFNSVSTHIETLYGHFNQIALGLQRPIHVDLGEILPIDAAFGAYSAGAHLQNDLFDNKIAFNITLNFPYYSLQEKEEYGKSWDRLNWAYARLGDLFTSRTPASIIQNYSRVSTDSEMYISQYNIQAGKLLTEENKTIFPEDMVLLSHWNLRDELKANYPLGDEGLEKQKMIYEVMKHIIRQTIPEQVINNPEYKWAPYSNKLFKNQEEVEAIPEPDMRYQQIINNFQALKAMDAYSPLDTYIRRNFEGSMEIAQPEVEELFIEFLSSDVLKEVGNLISNRLGRPLQPFDIWYDGFKARGAIGEDELSAVTRRLYPDAVAFENDIANLLVKLGYKRERANYLAEKISVDAARGSGHAWGAAIRGQNSYLRTRIPTDGMDYKGYNIAMHELGHNVEQTISLYDVDYYMLNGVPNTAFTEALAFMYQKRDLDLLGMPSTDPLEEALQTLDLIWASYEIMGVSLLDMRVWKWLYENPTATATQLKEAVITLATDIWNDFYAPVYGIKDQPILAIYSHMISYPLYLSAYAYGNIIEFQLEEYIQNRSFADETDRMFMLGRLTPNHWMRQAVGADIDIQPMLNAGREALKLFN